jgi:hypothetical protein
LLPPLLLLFAVLLCNNISLNSDLNIVDPLPFNSPTPVCGIGVSRGEVLLECDDIRCPLEERANGLLSDKSIVFESSLLVRFTAFTEEET